MCLRNAPCSNYVDWTKLDFTIHGAKGVISVHESLTHFSAALRFNYALVASVMPSTAPNRYSKASARRDYDE